MEKLVRSGWSVFYFHLLHLMVAFLVTFPFVINAKGCDMTCVPTNSFFQESLYHFCQDVLTYSQIGAASQGKLSPAIISPTILTARCEPPSAKCVLGLSANLMAMDLSGDGIADWGMVPLPARMFDTGSDHSSKSKVTLAFSSDPNDVTRFFDCGHVGPNDIELWAIDENGLSDFCLTTVDIQDNKNVCPEPLDSGTGIISGRIYVPGVGNLAGVKVYLDGSNQIATQGGLSGYFVFPAISFGKQYVVRPERNDDAKNGVTALDLLKIQKHLSGLETFSNQYQYIAADADNSRSITATDIIQLRKLILGYYDELPQSQSWRFIDEAYFFPNPFNPWVSAWPETYKISPFRSTLNEVNFQAVKIGDINLSANLQAGSLDIQTRAIQLCEIEYQITPLTEPDVYKVDLYLPDPDKYNALQFSFTWDESGFDVLDYNPGVLLSDEDIRMPQHPGEGASIVAYTTEKWERDQSLVLTMWVKRKSSGKEPFKLFLNSVPTNPVAYLAGLEDPVHIHLSVSDERDLPIHIQPNPFKEMTSILYQSTRQEDAVIHFFDLNGRLIRSRDVRLAVGENEFIVHQSELAGPGMYTYEIKSAFQHSTNRMIIVD